MALAAMVCSFVPLGITWIAAIVMACIALSQIRRREASGRGMAITALIVSALWFALLVVVIVLAVADEQKKDKARDEGSGDISVTQTRAGDCLVTIPGETEVSTVKIVPCTEPHRGEVFAAFELDVPDDASQAAIDRLAEGGCVSRFPGYVGVSFQKSAQDLVYLRPVKGSVDLDSGVACILATEQATTGSQKGSKR